MADELRTHAVLIVEALFERQQAQHQIDGFMDAARPALPPRPDLRTHVLHRRNAGGAQVARQAQIEFRRIDADEHVRPGRQEQAPNACAQTQQPRQMAQDLEQAHDGERFGGLPGLASRSLHLRAGNAEEFSARREPAQRMNQIGAQRVARRFARHQTHPQRSRHRQPELFMNDGKLAVGRIGQAFITARCCVRCA